MVLTRDSLTHHPASYWAETLGPYVAAVQVCNEVDAAPGSPSSDVMSQDALAEHLVDVSLAFPRELPLIGPGLCSGAPGWWDADLNARCDALAVHPYAKSAADAAALLRAYWDRWHKPIWVTEFGNPAPNGDPGYLAAFLDAVRPLDFVQVAISYWPSPAAINGRVGGEVSMPTFVLGFKDYAAAHPEVGQPIEDEQALAGGYQSQMTTNGLLLYSKQANAVQFHPKG